MNTQRYLLALSVLVLGFAGTYETKAQLAQAPTPHMVGLAAPMAPNAVVKPGVTFVRPNPVPMLPDESSLGKMIIQRAPAKNL